MREALNKNTLFNTIAMTRREIASLILVLEGDDDHFMVKSHRSTELFLVKGVGGKPTVLQAAKLVQTHKLQGVCFVVDRDFDRLTSPPIEYPENVIASESHDVFMDVVHADPQLVDRVIGAHARKAERSGSSSVSIVPTAVRTDALALAARMVPLRVANEKQRLGLNLSDFPFGKLRSVQPSNAELAALAIGRSNTALLSDDIVAAMRGEGEAIVDLVDLVGDHDFFRAIARILSDLGSKTSSAALVDSLVAAVHCATLLKTSWFLSVSAWATLHSRRAFKCPCVA